MKKWNSTEVQSVSDDGMKKTDIVVVIDKSGSMGDPSTRFKGKSKWEELKEDVSAIAREAAKFDDDGLTVIAFSGGVTTVDGVTPDAVAKVFSENTPRGSTNLAAAIEAATAKVVASTKPCAILVFTDGSPDDAKSAAAAIERAGKTLGRPRIGFTFVQVGNDKGAEAFLDYLDNEMKVDVVATVSAADAENLSVQQLVWLGQNA